MIYSLCLIRLITLFDAVSNVAGSVMLSLFDIALFLFCHMEAEVERVQKNVLKYK